MKLFEKVTANDQLVFYRLVFEKDEYAAVFDAPGYPHFRQMQYRKAGEEDYVVLNERTWAIAIKQVLDLVRALDPLEIDPHGGLLG